MKVLGIIVLILIAVAALGNMGDSDESKAAKAASESPAAIEGGLDSVHTDILLSTDCAELQETFDRNMSRYDMMDPLVRQEPGSPGEAMFAYANAANDRMLTIGC